MILTEKGQVASKLEETARKKKIPPKKVHSSLLCPFRVHSAFLLGRKRNAPFTHF